MTVRVLQVLARSAGGIARHVAQITGALDGGDGLEIDIAAPPDLPVEMPKPPLPVLIPDGPRGHRRAVRRLRAIITQGRYDAVHAHGLRAGIDAAIAARGLNATVLLTIHNLVQPEIAGGLRARLYHFAEPFSLRLADHTFAVSEEIARHLRRSRVAGAASVEVLYLGVGAAPEVRREAAEVRSELGLADERLIVTVARLSSQKALNVMLDALARLDDTVVLAVLGRGELQGELEEQARRLGLGGRIRFLGWRADVADFVAAGDVFCLSSIWEGVPLSVQEAILLGTPVVATAVGGMPEIITDGVSGRLVPRGDSSALAEALGEVLGDGAAARTYAARARQELEGRFSTPRMLDRLTAAYLEAGDHDG